ncbi:MAG: bifunctional glutamate N-acetyltransferase/amino-acid acetyltransferase ArgJ [Candidatus Omnitrophica bacterium]|nr:bifunctional glutamate N-acetyltransferase/amino-acid acetyltransferase ArgJ [Candidatus Omnitrophota bacterium]
MKNTRRIFLLPEGFRVAGTHAGIKSGGHLDAGLVICDRPFPAAAVFTRNVNSAYSVQLCKSHLPAPVKALLVNSGNANCFSHRNGLRDTARAAASVAKKIGTRTENVLLFSTGIIGKKLPFKKLTAAAEPLRRRAGRTRTHIDQFASSMLTTDTRKKISCRRGTFTRGRGTITGFAKGAGMIRPDMATMLAVVLTDVRIPKPTLRSMTRKAVEESFHTISIDECMSTNDSVLVISSGKIPLTGNKEKARFSGMLSQTCGDLARQIVRDGEGATKFVEVRVRRARSKKEAKRAAAHIVQSLLFKCAMHGENPNWGRIVAALGHAGIAVDYPLKVRASDLRKRDIRITVDLNRGKDEWTMFTTDLSAEYVKINAEYS